ncbi:MAG: DUF5777 family beta-barrel protein [Flavobacteriales bacterium]
MQRNEIRFYKTGLLAAALFCFIQTTAQQDTTDLLSLLGPEEPTTDYTTATFKTTRIINMHSVENAAEGVLDFRINHRFGAFNTGVGNLFGLDAAFIRLGFEYGINDRLMVGFGRSNVNKELDFFGKYKILRQSTGKKNVPISMSWFSSMVIRTDEFADPDRNNYFSSRLYYCHQLLIARKFNESLSFQLAPTVVHRNLVPDSTIANDVFALGAGGRMKMTRRSSINMEYVYVMPDQLEDKYTNSFSIGIDVETGGHVFQMHITNSYPMNEKGFITETTGKWSKGDIQFGWNISRVFTIKQRKQPKE